VLLAFGEAALLRTLIMAVRLADNRGGVTQRRHPNPDEDSQSERNDSDQDCYRKRNDDEK
jgi:hypothetical protein